MPGGLADPQQVVWRQASGPAENYRTLTRRLAASSAAALIVLYRQLTDGTLTASDLIAAGAVLLAASNQRSAGLADLYLARSLKVQPLGLISRTADAPRLEQALATALSDRGNAPQVSLPLIGEAEPLRAGQLAMTDGMVEHRVRGWTRVTSGTPCTYCANLADGTVLPPTVEMRSHQSCSCVQEVVAD